MECVPAVSAEVVNVACPPAFRAPVPIVVEPSRKATLPVGVAPVPVTAAVKVTLCPAADGLTEESRVVVVESPLAVLSKRYAAIAPVSGLLPLPVIVDVACCPFAANA